LLFLTRITNKEADLERFVILDTKEIKGKLLKSAIRVKHWPAGICRNFISSPMLEESSTVVMK
jgi:hypothetical protein